MPKRPAERTAPPPLEPDALRALALRYVSRYATSRARLRDYLRRKIRERGWAGGGDPGLDALIVKMTEAGLIDDSAFAVSRAGSFERRGLGRRRLDMRLRQDGIESEDAGEAQAIADDGAWRAAVRFAERKRLGPFASERADPAKHQKQFAAMMRAGHSAPMARLLLLAAPGEVPSWED